MNLDKERKAFEDYEHSKKMDCDRAILFRRWEDYQLDDDEKHYVGKYIDSFMQEKYELWLASANREGYKLVPVEPTERMLDSAYSSISDNLHYADLENIYTAMINSCDNN